MIFLFMLYYFNKPVDKVILYPINNTLISQMMTFVNEYLLDIFHRYFFFFKYSFNFLIPYLFNVVAYLFWM
jgi:hypothetical protein